MAEPKHVFISHSSKDRGKAEAVDAILRSWGVNTWMAPRDIGSGGTFAGQITKAVDKSTAMVVIVTPAACKSKFVHVEVERAFQKKKRLYPVRFDPVKLSGDIEFYLSAYQWVDAFEDDREEALERLAYDLGGRPVGEEDPVPSPSPLSSEPVPAAAAPTIPIEAHRPPPPVPVPVEAAPAPPTAVAVPAPLVEQTPSPPEPEAAANDPNWSAAPVIIALIVISIVIAFVVTSQMGQEPNEPAPVNYTTTEEPADTNGTTEVQNPTTTTTTTSDTRM